MITVVSMLTVVMAWMQVVAHCCLAHEAAIPPATVDVATIYIALHDMSNPTEVASGPLPP